MGERLYLERFIWFDAEARKGRYPNATGLARRCECSVKTAQRDIEYFRDRLGAPLEYDPSRKGYFYAAPGYQLPAMRLTESELTALLASRKLLSDAAAGPLGEELEHVSAKLGSLLERNLTGRIDPQQAFSLRWHSVSHGDPLIFQQTAFALLHCRPLSFCYYSPASGACTARTVEPHHMVNYMGNWHLVAWCRLRNDWRDFSLPRITLCNLGDDTFTPRDEQEWRPFLEGTFGIFQNRQRFEVTVRFSAERARWVRGEVWHPEQREETLEDGRLQLTLAVSHEAEIIMNILMHGAHAEVVGPEWLRKRVREEIVRMSKKYGM